METKSFQEIRKQYPSQYLVLVDFEAHELPSGDLEVTGAKYVHAYKTGKEMYEAYRDLAKKGQKAVFVTPYYQDSFTMEQRFSMRVGSVA
jgi:hypothetical protein